MPTNPRPKCARPMCHNLVKRADTRFCSPECWQDSQRKKDEPGDNSIVVAGDTAAITRTTHEKVRTLSDLIRVCEVDTVEWEIERWTCNAQQQASVPRATGKSKNWSRPSAEVVTTQLFHVKAWLKRKTPLLKAMEQLRVELVNDIRKEVSSAPRATRLARTQSVDTGWLFEFAPFDLHMGKYAWDEETVANYDTDIAADLFDASLDFLLNRAMRLSDGRLDRILCVFGNDVSHMDSKRGDTTMGTRMDVDTRYVRVYRRICEVHRRAVDRLLQVAPVDMVIIPGNHDELTSFHLGEILSARYDGTKHVTVDNSPRLRKYYSYGTNLFGFTHGDAEKVTELPLLMAREVPEMWSRCASREWQIGHKHIAEKFTWRDQDLFSDKGVRVRRLASLSAHDAWHTKHGYTDRRACDAFVFHKDAGFTDHLSFNCDHLTGRPLVPKK